MRTGYCLAALFGGLAAADFLPIPTAAPQGSPAKRQDDSVTAITSCHFHGSDVFVLTLSTNMQNWLTDNGLDSASLETTSITFKQVPLPQATSRPPLPAVMPTEVICKLRPHSTYLAKITDQLRSFCVGPDGEDVEAISEAGESESDGGESHEDHSGHDHSGHDHEEEHSEDGENQHCHFHAGVEYVSLIYQKVFICIS